MTTGPKTLTLTDAATRLGWSIDFLRSRIRQGAFPGRLVVNGELRLATADVERWLQSGSLTIVPDAPLDAHVEDSVVSVSPSGSALTNGDLDNLRQAFAEVVREERETLISAVASAFDSRDEVLRDLQTEVRHLRRSVESLETGLPALAASSQDTGVGRPWLSAPKAVSGMIERAEPDVDVDRLLDEIGELEVMLGSLDFD